IGRMIAQPLDSPSDDFLRGGLDAPQPNLGLSIHCVAGAATDHIMELPREQITPGDSEQRAKACRGAGQSHQRLDDPLEQHLEPTVLTFERRSSGMDTLEIPGVAV